MIMFYPLAHKSIDIVSFLIHRTHGICLVVLLKLSPSLSIFKKRDMDSFIVKPNAIYGIHNPIGLRYLTRLRVGLSHLRSHKYGHNFKDTETDICSCSQNTPETVEHFLVFCPQYNLIRSQLFEKLKKVISLVTLFSPSYTTNLFLYGNSIPALTFTLINRLSNTRSILLYLVVKDLMEHLFGVNAKFSSLLMECNAILFNVFLCFIICKFVFWLPVIVMAWGAGRWGRLGCLCY